LVADPVSEAALKKCLLQRVVLGGVILWMNGYHPFGGNIMKIWNKPQVREQAVGMEVTAYLPADIDLI
jgi:coenzyme PQQ precursor peptide PqqA